MKHGAMDDPCLACNATERDYETLLNVSRNDTYINKFYFYQTAQVAFLGGLLVAIVAGNSTVLLALLLAKTRKSRMNYFIMQLAIADLWVGLISVLPDLIQRMTISWLAGSAACKAMKFLQGVVTYSSTYVLVALSIDRCDAITHPMNFTGSWRRARALIVSSWCLSFLLCVPMLFLFDEAYVQGTPQCWSGISKLQWRLWISGVFVTLFVLPAVTITACYGIIVATIWHKGRRGREVMRQYSDDLVRTASSRGVIPKAKIKTVKMTFAIVFVFVLCWSPYMVFDLLQVYDYVPYTQANVAVASLIQSLAPLNSAANPVIYFLFSKRIFASLRNIPPYKWLWCGVLTDAKGDARPQTELLTSSHRKTKRDLTVKVLENSFNKSSKRSRGSKTVRMRLPDECEQANNNTRALSHARKSDTYL